MRRKSAFRLAPLVPCALLLAGLGAPPAQVRAEDSLPREIVITGHDIVRLRTLVSEAEDRMLALFNEFNDDDLYDFHCTFEAISGSKIKQKQCRPNYMVEAEEDVAKQQLGVAYTPPPIMAAVEFHTPKIEQKMREVMAGHPEFFDAVMEHYHLREVLKES